MSRLGRTPVQILLFSLFLTSSSIYLSADTIAGQVTDGESQFGIEGATIELDLDPPGGEPDAITTTDLFGYFRLREVQTGVGFTLTASHPAYDSDSTVEAALSAEDVRQSALVLNRSNAGATILDVQVSVRAVNPGINLEGVPVHAWRYSTSDGSDPADFRTARTDAEGNAHFRGFEAGYFQFSVNEPSDNPLLYYESYPKPAGRTPLTRLDTDHLLTALLKHEEQSINVRVLGFDPVARASTSLKGATVELTGLGPDKISRIVPTRTSETEDSGRVTFKDLAPIPWEVKVKLLGYDVATEIIEPDGSGAFNAGDYDIPLSVQPRALALTLNAEGYANVDWLFQNIEVELVGLAGTNTEGIRRTETAPGNFTGQERHDERIFRELIPGRYRASVAGQSNLDSYYPLPVFIGSGIIELTDDIEFEGALTTSDGIICKPAPARVRGRVFAADDMMERDGNLLPRYLPKAMTGVRFGEVEGNVQVNLLPEDARFQQFDTDNYGNYSISLTPTVYGISIPDAEDYWGDHVDWKDETTGAGVSQGWPYPQTWPFAFPIMPPRGYAQWPSLPLVLESGREYVVDIYLHKQRGVLQYFYALDSGSPSRELLITSGGNGPTTPEIALYDDLATPDTNGDKAIAMATPTDGGEAITGTVEDGLITFLDVPSGEYTVEVSHPTRYTFIDNSHTFPEWQPPGVLPTVAPEPLGVSFNQPLHISNKGNDNIEADYIPGTSRLTISIQGWNESTETYIGGDPFDGFDRPIWVQLPNIKNGIFEAQDRGMPQGPFKFWFEYNGGFWEDEIVAEGENKEIALIAGGPDNIPANSTGPSPNFSVRPRALFAPDPSIFIPGATFEANGILNPANGDPVTVSGGIVNIGTIRAPDGWIKENEVFDFTDVAGTEVTVELTATYVKGMTVSVTLKDQEDDTAITEASVRIRSAAGGRLTSAGLPSIALKHVDNGLFQVTDFAIAAALLSQECLVEVEAPGYEPFAKRVIPDGVPTPATLTLEASLKRLPRPEIKSAEFNRFGLFVPGIKLTGDESAFDPPLEPDIDPLVTQWTLMGEAADPIQVTVETIDGDPEANENNEVTRTIEDPVVAVYAIDSRGFDGELSDPEVTIVPSMASDPTRPASIRNWIRRVEDNTLPKVTNQRINFLIPQSSFEATGGFELPNLPPGVFEPGFIAMTARGASSFKQIPDYPGAQNTYKLEGARIPKWLSFATNVLTGIAVADANIAQAADFVPFGDYTPLDNFETKVELDPENAGFINYTYEMGTEWNFGIPTPERGFLMFAPGVIGINATAKTSFGSKGYMRELFLETMGDAQNEPAELKKKRLPAFFRKNPSIQFTGQVTITAANTINRSYNQQEPYELEVRTSLPETQDGKVTGFSFELTRSQDNEVLKIPVVGPKLRALAAADLLNHTGTLEGLIGLTADITFRTPRPPQFPNPETTHPEEDLRATRRHMFGGSVVSASFAPQMAFSGKVTTSVAGGVLEADLGVSLTGNEKAGKSFAEIKVNPFDDWPWIKQVSGGINLDLAGRVDAYIWQGEKKFSWQALPFDFQFGTQSVFALTPITITQQRISLGDTGPTLVDSDATQAFTNVSPLAKFDIAPASTPVLVYSEFNDNTDQVELKALTRSGNGWSDAETVGSAAAITAMTSLLLPDDRVVLAWSEVPASSLGEPFVASDIYFSVLGEGGSWSAPVLAASLSGTVFDLLPVEGVSFSGLVVTESNEGPGGQLMLKGLPWNGSGFDTIQSESTSRNCLIVDAVGATDHGLIYCINETGLTEITWDGTTFSTGDTDANLTTGPIAASRNPEGNVYRATSREGAITIEGFGENLAVLDTGASDLEMIYTNGSSEAVLLAWAETDSLLTAWFNPDTGALLSPIEQLTSSANGTYSELNLIPGTNGQATLLAKYRSDNEIELREFEIALTGSSTLNDSDGDGLDDLKELSIIDANTDDNITTLADVQAGDDFDLDGETNGDEITNGTDPTESSLELPDEDLGITAIVFGPDGSLSITITSFPGETYTLQTGILNSAWTDVESKIANNVLVTFTIDGVVVGESFYRIGTE